jgi:hypothetical protein
MPVMFTDCHFAMRSSAILICAMSSLVGCNQAPPPAPTTPATTVDATGKQSVSLESVPPEVVAAVMAARPGIQIAEAEHEQRNGNDYYDVEGTLNGAEIELDLTKIDGSWKVVEIQRDIATTEAPAAVMTALTGTNPQFAPSRIIESDQGTGVVIYEFFGPDSDGKETKLEVKLENGTAEVLASEWVH